MTQDKKIKMKADSPVDAYHKFITDAHKHHTWELLRRTAYNSLLVVTKVYKKENEIIANTAALLTMLEEGLI